MQLRLVVQMCSIGCNGITHFSLLRCSETSDPLWRHSGSEWLLADDVALVSHCWRQELGNGQAGSRRGRGARRKRNPACVKVILNNQHQRENMEPGKPVNACRRCGATSYRPVLSRATDGAMRPSGQYMCVRCKVLFTTIDQWRLGEGVKQAA